MSDHDLDELFGDEGGAPEPRSGLILGLLTAGVSMAVLGLACSSPPGALLVLLAWYYVDKDLDRIDNGYLPADTRPRVRRLQYAVWGAVALVLVVFAVQAWLLSVGAYDLLWGAALASLGELLGVGPT